VTAWNASYGGKGQGAIVGKLHADWIETDLGVLSRPLLAVGACLLLGPVWAIHKRRRVFGRDDAVLGSHLRDSNFMCRYVG
jgi:hypothetical protein